MVNMNIYPFFNINTAITTDNSIHNINSGIIGFFICSFDLINGLNILFSSPYDLKDNPNELSVLKTHCIWKLETIPLKIDLKLSEFVYSAFQLNTSLNKNIDVTIKEPIYGGVLKLSKTSKSLPASIVRKFKEKIEKEINTNLYLLHKRNILSKNPIKKKEFNELGKITSIIEENLLALWKGFEGEVNTLMGFNKNDIKYLDKMKQLEKKKKLSYPRLFVDKITMRKISSDENPNHLMVILVNQIEDLQNVTIHVSRISEFFSEILWEQELKEWPLKEDLILEFHRSNIKQKFLIKISSNKATISIKSLET